MGAATAYSSTSLSNRVEQVEVVCPAALEHELGLVAVGDTLRGVEVDELRDGGLSIEHERGE